MHPYDSLRQKLVQPFLLLGFVVSSTLSLTTFALLAHIEERAITRTLHVELESFHNRRATNPQAKPADSGLLRGVFLPVRELPPPPELGPESRIQEIRTIGDVDYSILYARVDGQPFALLYDRSYIKSNLANLAFLLLVATAVMTFVSFLVGYRLSRRVIHPILKLITDVSAKADLRGLPGQRVVFDDKAYPPDEIGALVKALDRFSDRLHHFAQRESYFAADVSHELRTPVAVISGTAEVLSELPELSDLVRKRIATVYRNAARTTLILEAMLLLAKEQAPDADPFCNVEDVVIEAIADCTPSLEDRPVVIIAEDLTHVHLPVERSLVYVLISNILRNACAYTRQGCITISLTTKRLQISDTGIGMPDERLSEMFSRYAKGDESTGYGLGLSIVARICERLKWTISVNSVAGQGSVFTFTFGDNMA
ncbi:MAG: HAMP domain-containing sensor histidine kinase [Burkholderiaceae bacterium]|jgi:signal transduction histidine kinase